MKYKVVTALLLTMMVLASCGKAADPVEVESETVSSSSSMIVTDETQTIAYETDTEEETEESLLTGSGTGDTVAIENEYDLAYENQLAEEENVGENPAATIMYATGAVNVRDAANTTAAIVGKYNKNDMVFVYEIEGDWARVNYNEESRYVNKNYLSDTKVAESTSTTSTTKDNAGAQSQSKSQSENRISEEAAQNGTQTGTSENVAPVEDTTGATTPSAGTGMSEEEERKALEEAGFSFGGFSDDYVPNHEKVDLSGGYPGDPSEIEGITLH